MPIVLHVYCGNNMSRSEILFIASIIVLGLAIFIFAAIMLGAKDEECSSKDGILIKAVNGYVCIDKGVLK